MSAKAEELYLRAFGKERYNRYESAVNITARIKEVEEDIELQLMCFHDAESFAWIHYQQVVLAWAKISAVDELNMVSLDTINRLHTLRGVKSRHRLFDASKVE